MKKQVKKTAVLWVMLLVFQVFAGYLGTGRVQAAGDDVVLYLNRTSYTNGNVYVQVHTDFTPKSILFKKGSITKTSASYWSGASNITSAKKVKVTANGTYSVKVTDKAGNVTVRRIAVTNIDKKNPTVSLSQKKVDGGVAITIKASDYSGIKSVKYVKGNITDVNSTQFAKAADVTKTKTFKTQSNGTYSVLVADGAGNKVVKQIYVAAQVSLIDIEPSGGADVRRERTHEDIFGNQFDKGLLLTTAWGRAKETEYVNKGYGRLKGTIMVPCDSSSYVSYNGDSSEMKLNIYADDMLIYSSPNLTKKTQPIELDIDISGTTFIRFEIQNLSSYSCDIFIADPLFTE